MTKLLFAMLLIVDGTCVGLAGFVGWVDYRLATLGQHERYGQAITKLGIVLGVGIVVIRQATLGEAQASWASWGFLGGMSVMTVGLAMQAKSLIERLASAEYPKDGEDASS